MKILNESILRLVICIIQEYGNETQKEDYTPERDNIIKNDKTDNDENMEKFRIKQRLVKFSFKIFDKFDLNKIFEFWISRFCLN